MAICDALCDASHLSGAVVAGLGGSRSLADALRGHQLRLDRDDAFTLRVAGQLDGA